MGRVFADHSLIHAHTDDSELCRPKHQILAKDTWTCGQEEAEDHQPVISGQPTLHPEPQLTARTKLDPTPPIYSMMQLHIVSC